MIKKKLGKMELMQTLDPFKKPIHIVMPMFRPVHHRIQFLERLCKDLDLSVTLVVEDPRQPYEYESSSPSYSIVASPGIKTLKMRNKRSDSGTGFTEDIVYVVPVGLLFKLMKLRPDVILSAEVTPRTLVCLIYKYLFRKRLIISVEGTPHSVSSKAWYQRILWKLVARRADGLWASFRAIKPHLMSLGVAEERIFFYPHSVDNDFFYDRSHGLDREKTRKALEVDSQTVFLYVGQLISRKGLTHLLEAWMLLSSEMHRNSKLWLIGGGTEEKALREIIAKKRLSNVHLLGTKTQDELPIYYGTADVFILPTLEDNWGLVVNEAMACGLPVLCSKWAGASELVRDGQNGYTFDPLDHRATAGVMETIYHHRDRLKDMGTASLDFVKDYNYERMCVTFKQVISYVVQSGQETLENSD